MKTEEATDITETTLHDILLLMNSRITHIEDTVMDIREIMIKLVKQGNQVVGFLKQLQADVDDQYELTEPPSFEDFTKDKLNNRIDESTSVKDIQDIIDGLKEKNNELKELEEELQKNKDKITPGLHGES
jgi:hypothetical protein